MSFNGLLGAIKTFLFSDFIFWLIAQCVVPSLRLANFVVCVSPRLLHSYALYLGLPVPAVEEVDESS